jgi:alkylation response protein AidB-like acyl-CoA dehydrogenase
MAVPAALAATTGGGAFLIESVTTDSVFTPEDLSEEHLAIGRTAERFWAAEIEPNLEAIQHQHPDIALQALRKSAQLGLTSVTVPERFGGMEMDMVSDLVVAERLGRDGSYAAWHGAHATIGTLPLLYFGTEEQKQKYLPRLARVELLAAYALTEPHAGSDALAARTRADISPDGAHYILNGQKMWITNGGAADLFTVFAKVNGEKLTAFIVERNFTGVSSGPEEKKMGIKGSSTTAVYFENVPVPAENVLGEIGRGHIIAFNILNNARLKLGMLAVGAAKDTLAASLKYARERRAFGRSIGDFGAIQHKLAEMACRIYVAESAAWRVAGQIQAATGDFSWGAPDASRTMLKALEQHAAECSMVKVHGSETLDFVVDEGVQIHGGYGYHQDYAVERAYRDSRINRIFEGTNEINRLLITGMLLKRAARGQLALFPAADEVLTDFQNEPRAAVEADPLWDLVHRAKKIALLAFGVAHQRFGVELETHQEIVMYIADVVIDAFTMESSLLRTRKLAAKARGTTAGAICSVVLYDAIRRIEAAAEHVIAACQGGNALRRHFSALKALAAHDPINAIGVRREIAAHLLSKQRYAI